MKRKIAASTLAVALAVGGLLFASPAMATEGPVDEPQNTGVCEELSSGKIDVEDGIASMDITAPEGKLIVGYCVKAGSENQGNGPEYVEVDPGKDVVTISHSSGKDISHYSARYEDVTPEGPSSFSVCHGYGTAEAAIVTVSSLADLKVHMDHGDAPMSAENCESSRPEVFTAEVCHGYGTADAEIITVDSKDALKEHMDHGDAPMSAKDCADSRPVVEEPKFPICHVTVQGDTEGESLQVTKGEIKEHLAHGDYPGACVNTPVDPEPEPVAVTLGTPEWEDVCGTDDDGAWVPSDTDSVEYSWKSDDPAAPEYWTLLATVADGYVVEGPLGGWKAAGEGVYEFVIPMTDKACETMPTPKPDEEKPSVVIPSGNGNGTGSGTSTPTETVSTESLAQTGGDVNPILPIAGGAAVMLGLAVMVLRRLVRR